MAKAKRVQPKTAPTQEEVIKEDKPYTANEDRIQELEQLVKTLSGFKDGSEAALLHMSGRVDEIEQNIIKCFTKLEAEKNVRLKARDAKLHDIDYNRLNEMVLKVIMSHYLSTEANDFDRLVSNNELVKSGATYIVRLHSRMMEELESAIRGSD